MREGRGVLRRKEVGFQPSFAQVLRVPVRLCLGTDPRIFRQATEGSVPASIHISEVIGDLRRVARRAAA